MGVPDIWGQSDAHRETTALSWDTYPISHSKILNETHTTPTILCWLKCVAATAAPTTALPSA